MKRYISLALAAVVLICSLAVPSYASEVESNTYFNVLDYDTANGSGLNSFGSGSTFVATATYTIPFKPHVRYVDIVFTSADGEPSSVLFRGTELTLARITNRVFRAYGTVNVTGSSYDLTFNSDTAGVSYNIISFHVSTYSSFSYDIEGYWDLKLYQHNTTIHYVPTDEINDRYITASGEWSNDYFESTLWSTDWRKFDYIDYYLEFEVSTLLSISAIFDDFSIPLEVSYYYPPGYHPQSIFVNIRIDLTSLDRTKSGNPLIYISGSILSDYPNLFRVLSITGSLRTDNIDPVSFWLFTIYHKFDSFSSSISSSTSAFFSKWSSDMQRFVDRIVRAINGDNNYSQNMMNTLEEPLGMLDALGQGMSSIEAPNPDELPLDINIYLPSSDINSLSAPMALLFENDIVKTTIMISLTVALIAFILFGKR